MLLGHEGAGVVEAVGEGVGAGRRRPRRARLALAVRRVPLVRARRPAPLPHAAARRAPACARTATSCSRRCSSARSRRAPSSTSRPAIRIPDGLPPEQACLIGCAVATGVGSVLETAQVWEGARVGVIGCGAVGLSAVQGARIAGAAEIYALDLDERKLEAARRFGATHTGPGEQLDFVFDVVGRPETVDAGPRDARPRRNARLHRPAAAGRARRARAEPVLRQAHADPRLARRRPLAGRRLPAARAVGARRQARPRRDGDEDDRARRRRARVRRSAGAAT